ncbi:hypothetical protein LS482_02450 [Sinomicrobium kalidii]|nr:hypothetical protein [Sinomicrobium kalidii]UGU16741.1 hypothetical protein LS482_02450 [Sinomicrobium kalidii]
MAKKKNNQTQPTTKKQELTPTNTKNKQPQIHPLEKHQCIRGQKTE